MLSEMGRSYGRMIAKEVMSMAPDPEIVLKVLEGLASAAGWGQVDVRGDLRKGEVIEVFIRNCAFCSDGEQSQESRCHFIAGVTAGVAGEAFNAEFKASEHECMRKGGSRCVIALERE
ncbi:MAG: hypothetical protein HY296_00570 [Thaumarchaeota archaeon]|nr:hypothetical protein [Nitrososphaerota archaeon]